MGAGPAKAAREAPSACTSKPSGNGIEPATRKLAKLDMWVGHWSTRGATVAPDGRPGDSMVATDIYEWLPGGFAMMHCFHVEVGGGSFDGVEIIGYDAARRDYPMYSLDSVGTAGVNRARKTGPARWVFRGEFMAGGRPVAQRTLARFQNGRSFVDARFEQSTDGGRSWRPLVNVRLTKITTDPRPQERR